MLASDTPLASVIGRARSTPSGAQARPAFPSITPSPCVPRPLYHLGGWEGKGQRAPSASDAWNAAPGGCRGPRLPLGEQACPAMPKLAPKPLFSCLPTSPALLLPPRRWSAPKRGRDKTTMRTRRRAPRTHTGVAHAYARVRQLEHRVAEAQQHLRAEQSLLSAARDDLASAVRGAPSSPAAAADVLALPELAHAITADVGAGDMLAWALACKGFRAAQLDLRLAAAAAAGGRGRIVSPAGEFMSLPRVEWITTPIGRGADGEPMHMVPGVEDQRRFCELAAGRGELRCLQALRTAGCIWDEGGMYRAAGGGHLEVLQWAREHGCPWDEWTCMGAARGGHLEVLQWAREHGCPWDENTCSEAARCGQEMILLWLREQGCPCGGTVCGVWSDEHSDSE